jgi:hypothetical protein
MAQIQVLVQALKLLATLVLQLPHIAALQVKPYLELIVPNQFLLSTVVLQDKQLADLDAIQLQAPIVVVLFQAQP